MFFRASINQADSARFGAGSGGRKPGMTQASGADGIMCQRPGHASDQGGSTCEAQFVLSDSRNVVFPYPERDCLRTSHQSHIPQGIADCHARNPLPRKGLPLDTPAIPYCISNPLSYKELPSGERGTFILQGVVGVRVWNPLPYKGFQPYTPANPYSISNPLFYKGLPKSA